MAELVERHMESMTEEIEEMRRTNLFSVNETRIILKKRKHFEYKINGVTKNLQDFNDYIQYEKIILRDIKIRRNKLKVAERKSGIEFKILKRIKYLYEIALQRFSNDFPLCLSYFKFCKESNYHKAASLVVQNMTKTFSHMAEVWQVAAAWHIKRDVSQALNIIYKGLAIHKDCKPLYSEAIQLELLNREKEERSDDSSAAKANELFCKKIETYVQAILKNINDFSFLIEVLNLLEPHNFTMDIQNIIIKSLLSHHSDEELVWHTLAQREKNGHHYDVTDESFTKSTRFRLKSCVKKYEEGLTKIAAHKKPELWKLYLDFLIDLHEQSVVVNTFEKKILIAALEEASKQITLNEKYYIVWAKLVEEETEVLGIIEKGLVALPESVELWKLRMKYAVMKDNVTEFNQIFGKAILSLKEKSAPIWIMGIRYHSLTSRNGVIDMIYKDAVKQPKEISDIFKPEYIQWLALCKGIKDARTTYKSLAKEKPYCKELHTAMAKIESIEVDRDVKELESVLKLACEQFSHEDVDVTINLIEFYLKHHVVFENSNPDFDLNEKILQIYKETEDILKDKELLLADFKEKFDLIKQSVDI